MERPDVGTKEDLARYRIETAKEALKDAIGNFNKKYVKSEQFPREIGHRLAELEEIRHASDYDDFYIATKDEAIEQIETAEMLISKIEEYISNRSGKDSK